VHDVAVALERHHLVQFETPVFDDPSDIVASKIDEHDVFGDLFGVFSQFSGQMTIFFLSVTASPGACDRA
jgi:hypothetical protein